MIQVVLFIGFLFSLCSASQNITGNAYFAILPTNYLEVSKSGKMQTELLWSRYKSNLNDIFIGLERITTDMEVYPTELIDSCLSGLGEKAQPEFLRLYIKLSEMKLLVSHLRNEAPMKLDVQIPNMRLLQLSASLYWETSEAFDENLKSIYEKALIKSLDKYNDPGDEKTRALDLNTSLVNVLAKMKQMSHKLTAYLSFNFKNITLLLHRIVMSNCILYTIQERSSFRRPAPSQELKFIEDIEDSNETRNFFLTVSGLEKVLDFAQNVNLSCRLLFLYVYDNDKDIGKVSPATAIHTIKSMMFSELSQFYKTGRTTSIVSRHLLQVIIEHKDMSGIQELYECAKSQYELLEKLGFEEKRNNLIAPSRKSKAKKEPAKISKNKVVQKKKKNNKGKPTKPKVEKKEPIPSVDEEYNDENASDEEDFQVAKVTLLKTPFVSREVNYLRIGQFCYDYVLYPLLSKLQMANYTWTNVSEMCSTEVGMEALAQLRLNQSQVDFCIKIVRDRVPHAHPEKLSPENVMHDLSILKTQHIQKHAVFDVLGKHLATKTDWKLVTGAQVRTFEPAKLVHAALRVGEYCWREVVDPVAISLGLNTTTTSLTEIFEQAKINGFELDLLNTCRSLIKLRNSYAHQGVSSEDAKEALLFIYQEDPEKPLILDNIFNRVVNPTFEGIEFY